MFYFGVNLLIIYIIRITQKKRTKNLMGGMCWRTPHTWETANTLRKVQVTKNREMQFQQKKSEKGNWREMVVPLLFCETSNTLLMSVSMVVATVRNTLHYGLELVHTWGMESLRRLRSPFCEKRFAWYAEPGDTRFLQGIAPGEFRFEPYVPGNQEQGSKLVLRCLENFEYFIEPKGVNCLRFLFSIIYVGCSARWTLCTCLNQRFPFACIYLKTFIYLVLHCLVK